MASISRNHREINKMKTHYDTLGVKKDASQAEIKKAFKKKASQHHPDKVTGSDEAMAMVNVAYEILKDPNRRKHYNETGSERPILSMEQEIRNNMFQMFTDLLEAPGDIVELCKVNITGNIERTEDKIIEKKGKIKYLKIRRKDVKTKKGKDNYFHSIVDARLADHKRQIEQLKETIKMFRGMEAAIVFYEFTGEIETPQQPKYVVFQSSTFGGDTY